MLGAFWQKLRDFANGERADSEMDTEIAGHIQLLAFRYEQQGLSPEDARSAARRQFGNVTLLRENQREQRTFALLASSFRNLRLAARQLRSHPGFTITAVLSLALGIGANTTVFTIVDRLILRLLPVKDPARLVMISAQGPTIESTNGEDVLSYPVYEGLQRRAAGLEFVFCRFSTSADLSAGGRPERVSAELVSGNYFESLGAMPLLGRVFTPRQDDRTSMAHPSVVLTYAYWMARFGGNPRVVGSKVLINKYPMRIVGVARPNFLGVDPYEPPQVFVPIQMQPALEPGQNNLGDPWTRWVQVFGRLKPGYTVKTVTSPLQLAFTQALEANAPDAARRGESEAQISRYLQQHIAVAQAGTGYSDIRNRYANALLVVKGMAGLILLVACSNVANLLIARAVSRQKETAVHLAIGASRGTLVRRLFTESLLISLLAAAAATALAYLAAAGLLTFLPDHEHLNLPVAPDLRILLFSLAACPVTALLFGLLPALRGTRIDVWNSLKDSAGSMAGSRLSLRTRKFLLTFQVALSFLLLAGAALFTRSLMNLDRVNTGFSGIDHIYRFQVDASRAGYGVPQQRALYNRILFATRAQVGVSAAAYAMVPVLSSYSWVTNLSIEGHSVSEDRSNCYNAVSPGFWQTVGMRLLAGRDFDASDVGHHMDPHEQLDVAIVNRAFAVHYFGSAEQALGRHLGFAGMVNRHPTARIIGVVSDALYDRPQSGQRRQVFFAFPQSSWPSSATYYVRTANNAGVIGQMRRLVASIDPTLPIYATGTLQDSLETTLGAPRLIATLSLVFAGLAVVLASIGLYGVMAFAVTRRTKEIGLRMVLGAKQHIVLWSVVREALGMVLAGLLFRLPRRSAA